VQIDQPKPHRNLGGAQVRGTIELAHDFTDRDASRFGTDEALSTLA
jgi:hypothetical protein